MKNTNKTRSFRFVMSVVSAMLLVAFGTPALAQSRSLVLHVPEDYATIQAAVDAATEGNTVQVAAGLYNEKVAVSMSNIRLHAAEGAVLDGTGFNGIGISVRGLRRLRRSATWKCRGSRCVTLKRALSWSSLSTLRSIATRSTRM